jgi:hypothetical protein
MSFWTETDPTKIQEPKRKFRFHVYFDGLDSPILWWAKTATKPSFQIASAEHKYLNHTFYYPGSITWQDVTITLVDPIDPDMAASLSDIVQLSGYQPPTSQDGSDEPTLSKDKAVGALGKVYVTQLDSDGVDLETWTLNNAWISELKYGDLEYGSDELTELSITMKYDWATITSEAAGSSAKKGSGGKEFFKI